MDGEKSFKKWEIESKSKKIKTFSLTWTGKNFQKNENPNEKVKRTKLPAWRGQRPSEAEQLLGERSCSAGSREEQEDRWQNNDVNLHDADYDDNDNHNIIIKWELW